MALENWHTSFNPQKFLSRVDLDKLIEHNEAYKENKINQGSTPCILCSSKQGPGILLNDKSYLCRVCFHKASTIQYPEVYEEAKKSTSRKESRRIAFEEFANKYGYSEEGNGLGMLIWLSGMLLSSHHWMNERIVPTVAIMVAIFFLIRFIFIKLKEKRKLNAWLKLKEKWENHFPEPTTPILRHFHDPQAILTDQDQKIIKIFNNWPGYPPFWNYLREVVLTRDGNHCQVSGCPSRVSLHVHHIRSVAKGGEHVPDNLVSLCDFHHALEPDEGHERIWSNIKTRYFTMVKAHERHNRTNSDYYQVKAHVRRLELVNTEELKQICKFYLLSCPECGSEQISITVSDKVEINCDVCNKAWSGPRELTEETGPRLAELLSIKRNRGIWKARWDMLSSRSDNVFSSLGSEKKSKSESKKKQPIKSVQAWEKPLCPQCGSPMKLITPKPGQEWQKFWGCTKYGSTGCRGSRKVQDKSVSRYLRKF